jgi:hypothetical protein
MKKISFNIDKITEEPNPQGAKKLKIRVRSDGLFYTFGVKKSDYLNDASRESIHAVWIRNIKERKAETEYEKNPQKSKKVKNKLDALLGNAVEEEE